MFKTDSSLILSGSFTEINSASINYIADFDGGNYDSLGVGVLGQPKAYALFESKIFMAGGSLRAGGDTNKDALVVWNGSSWEGFGSSTSLVSSIRPYKGKLYGVGSFSSLFGWSGLNDMFAYDGASFSKVGDVGLQGGPLIPEQLVVYDSLLLVGGLIQQADGISVSNIAAWDGNNWMTYAGGVSDRISTMFVDTINEYLYISGSFTSVGGVLPVSYFAKWDGQNWFDVGGGVDCPALEMSLYQNQLYIGGCFENVGGNSIKYISRYNGQTWDSLGVSTTNALGVSALEVFQDELYVGGNFAQIGDTIAPGLAKWSYPLDSACQEMYAGIGVHPDTIYTGQLPYTFRSGCYGNSALQWEFSDGYISGKGHCAYNFNNTPGTYDIMLTAQCGTEADTVYSQVVIVSNAAVEEKEPFDLNVYPNPSDGNISVVSEQLIGKKVQLSIYDLQGKQMYQKQLNFNSDTLQLALDLANGSYQLSLIHEDQKVVKTIQIE